MWVELKVPATTDTETVNPFVQLKVPAPMDTEIVQPSAISFELIVVCVEQNSINVAIPCKCK